MAETTAPKKRHYYEHESELSVILLGWGEEAFHSSSETRRDSLFLLSISWTNGAERLRCRPSPREAVDRASPRPSRCVERWIAIPRHGANWMGLFSTLWMNESLRSSLSRKRTKYMHATTNETNSNHVVSIHKLARSFFSCSPNSKFRSRSLID